MRFYACGPVVLLALAGCKTPAPIAPTYGSSPALSTTEGFIVGKWRSDVDDTQSKDKNLAGMAALFNNIFKKTLDFHKDGTYDITVNKRAKGTGKWKVSGDGVDLQLTSFDNGPAVMGRDPMDLSSFARDVTHLSLNPDKKRLQETDPTAKPGSPSTKGMLTWDRVMK